MDGIKKTCENVKDIIPYGKVYGQDDLKMEFLVEKEYIGKGEKQYKNWGVVPVGVLLKNGLVRMEYSMDLENVYGIKTTIEETLAWKTFQDVYDYVKKKIQEKNGKNVETIIEP